MDILQKPAHTNGVATIPASKSDETTFHPSASTSIGVEIELQILDRDTSDLAPAQCAFSRHARRKRSTASRLN